MPDTAKPQDSYTILTTATDLDGGEGSDIEGAMRKYGPHALDMLRNIIDAYIDIEDDDRDVLAAWLLAAGFHQGFMTMPILYINASKGSGKSRLLQLINAILPDSIRIVDITESGMFRLAQKYKALLLDEAEQEKISNKEKVNITELLNSCYKKGGVVVRVERRKVDKDYTYVPVEYPVFIPVAIANTFGIKSIIEDRSITIIMRKTDRKDIIGTPELFGSDPVIKAIRNWFSVCCVGVYHVLEYQYTPLIASHFLYNNKYTYYTLPTLLYKDDNVEKFIQKSEGLYADGRSRECWLPLLEIIYIIDPSLLDRYISLAQQRIQDKADEGAEFDTDTAIAATLWTYLEEARWQPFTPKDFRDWYFGKEGIPPSEQRRHFLSVVWVGHFMKRIKVILHRKRTGRGWLYEIAKGKLRKYLEVRSAMPDSTDQGDAAPSPAAAPRAQAALSLHSAQNAAGEVAVQEIVLSDGPTDIALEHLTCDICHKDKTCTMYRGKVTCIDCMNAAQHAQDEEM